MQIGCDPKADSTIALRDGEPMPAVLDIYNEKKGNVTLKEITRIGYKGLRPVCRLHMLRSLLVSPVQ